MCIIQRIKDTKKVTFVYGDFEDALYLNGLLVAESCDVAGHCAVGRVKVVLEEGRFDE